MRALVPARLDETWILLDAEIIREILGAQVWLPIPGARAEMPGVIAWRGRAIPVVDLAAPFGLARLAGSAPRGRTLIASVAECIVALPVDAAREVHAFSTSDLRPCSVTELPYTSTETEVEGRILAVVDLHLFVAEILGGTARGLQAHAGNMHATSA